MELFPSRQAKVGRPHDTNVRGLHIACPSGNPNGNAFAFKEMPPRKRKKMSDVERLRRQKERTRDNRASESDEETQRRRVADAAAHRARRAEEPDAVAARRRENHAAAVAFLRANETPEEAARRQARIALHMRAMRTAFPPEEAAERRAQHAENVAAARSVETREAAAVRRAENAELLAAVRAAETAEAADERRALNAVHMAEVRAAETPQQAVERRVTRNMRYQIQAAAAEVVVEGAAAPAPNPNPLLNQRPGRLSAAEHFERNMAGMHWETCPDCKRRQMTNKRGTFSCGARCPRFWAANNMDPGVVPDELKGLSFIEQQLIARIHPMIAVYKLKRNQLCYSGHVINFPQNVNQVATALPHRIQDLTSLVVVRTQGADGHVDFQVRAGVIRRALLWLKSNNRYYRDISISEENLAELDAVDGGDAYPLLRGFDTPPAPPPAPAQPAQPAQQADEQVGEQVGEQADEDVDDPAAGVDSIHTTGVPILQPEHQDDQVRTVLGWPDIDRNPVNERSPGYIAKAFPHLFPYGNADLRSGRLHKVNPAEYFTFLLEYEDGRFAQHPTFRFFAMNSVMRWTALNAGGIYVRNNPRYRNMTAAQLREAIEADPTVLKQIMFFASRLRGTKPFWQTRCGELLDMVRQLGPATLFITLSAADLHWEDLFRLLAPNEDPQTMSDARRQQLLNENPLIADTFFYHRFKNFLDTVLKVDLQVIDYWFRFEYQHRGSPHVHGVVWLRGAPDVRLLADMTPQERDDALHYFVDDERGGYHGLVSTMNPGVGLPPAEVHPSRRRPHEVAGNEVHLGELLNRVQRHTRCSDNYCLRVDKNTGLKVCRFHFPQELQESSKFIQNDKGQFELITKRNDALVNSFMFKVIVPWGGNMDGKVIASLDSVLRYIAKYSTKSESRSQTYAELMAAVLENTEVGASAKTFVQKLFMRSLSERDYSAQETCHIVTSLPLYFSSRKFVVLNFRKDIWVQVQPARRAGNAEDEELDQDPDAKVLADELAGEDADQPAGQGAAEGVVQEDVQHAGVDEGEAVGAPAGAADLDNDLAEETFSSLVTRYQQRRRADRRHLSLREVALAYSPKGRNGWSKNRVNAIVRVFPRIKLSADEGRNEEYYHIEVLLRTAWQTEAGAKAGFGTWKEAFQYHGLVAEDDDNLEAGVAAAAAAAAAAAEEDQLEEPAEAPEGRGPLEEFMVVSVMGPNQRAQEVELGRREMDLNHDWHAASAAYGEIPYLKDFITSSKETHVLAESVDEMPSVTFTPEQQVVLDLVQSQINSITNPQAGAPVVKRVIIQGKAGCGKSTVIRALKVMIRAHLGRNSVKLLAPTGAAALNLGEGEGETIHSALAISPQARDYRELTGQQLQNFRARMEEVKFIIIDEYSMIGCRLLHFIEQRLRCAFPRSDEAFGGCFLFLIGDMRQLPPIGDTPVYSRKQDVSNEVAQGRLAWASMEKSIILSVSQRQADTTFRDALDRVCVGETTDEDYRRFAARFTSNLSNAEVDSFRNVMHMFPTRPLVAAHNLSRLVGLNCPVARIPAKLHGAAATSASKDDQGLDVVLYLAKGARVILRSNLWLRAGLVNGSVGTVADIVYEPNKSSPDDPPAVVMVKFDNYVGPTIEGLVPVAPVMRSWLDKGANCSMMQVPLRLAWASTVHSGQGMSVDSIVVDIGPSDWTPGLTYVALTRCKTWEGLMIAGEEFPKERLTKCRNSPGFKDRQWGELAIRRLSS